jgi:hypothetical protein
MKIDSVKNTDSLPPKAKQKNGFSQQRPQRPQRNETKKFGFVAFATFAVKFSRLLPLREILPFGKNTELPISRRTLLTTSLSPHRVLMQVRDVEEQSAFYSVTSFYLLP